jgi:hypothetical protein
MKAATKDENATMAVAAGLLAAFGIGFALGFLMTL